MNRRLIMLAVSLTVAACGGGDDDDPMPDGGSGLTSATITPSEGGTLSLDNGRFVVEVPAGAVDQTVEISGRLLPPSEYPAGFDNVTVGYELLPEGLQFNVPAIARATLGFDELGLSADSSDIPLFAMDSVSGDDTVELSLNGNDDPGLLDERGQFASYASETVSVVGHVHHFSKFLVSRWSEVWMRYQPTSVSARIGERWSPYMGVRTAGFAMVGERRFVSGNWHVCGKTPNQGFSIGLRHPAPVDIHNGCVYAVDAAVPVPATGLASHDSPPWLECTEAGSGEFSRTAVVRWTREFDGWQSVTHFVPRVFTPITCEAATVDPPRCDPTDPSKEPLGSVEEKFGQSAARVCQDLFDDAYPKPTKHSTTTVSDKPAAGDHTQLQSRVLSTISLAAGKLAELFGASVFGPAPAEYPCGPGGNGHTLCAGAGVPPAGDFFFAATVAKANIPLSDSTNRLEYAFVFDSDGNTTNNWTGFPAFPNDFFIGSDRWYVAKYDPASGWSIEVSDANGQTITPVTSDARIIIVDNVVVLLVPTGELTVSQPSYRVTAFRHTGDFGIDPPHDWDGSVFPAVADGLAPFDALPPLAQ